MWAFLSGPRSGSYEPRHPREPQEEESQLQATVRYENRFGITRRVRSRRRFPCRRVTRTRFNRSALRRKQAGGDCKPCAKDSADAELRRRARLERTIERSRTELSAMLERSDSESDYEATDDATDTRPWSATARSCARWTSTCSGISRTPSTRTWCAPPACPSATRAGTTTATRRSWLTPWWHVG